ncbi:MAG: hypothetical protein HC802_15665 [Caldilineaceae bacterium]|nr:hypothetical protein [Caldilineaceae bacterium]
MTKLLEIKLLGPPEALLDGKPITGFRSGKAQALLYYLTATRQPHSRSTLAGLFWGDVAEQHARRSLTSVLSNLKQLIPEHLQIERDTVEFDRERAHQLDVAIFEEEIDAGSANVEQLRHEISRYRADFMDGFYIQDAPEFEQWMLGERTRLREKLLGVLFTLADLLVEKGDLEGAIECIRRILGLEPWREDAHRRLMVHLAQNGQRAAALAQFDRCRTLLAEELGVDPEAETVELAEQIRRGSVARRAQPPRRPMPSALPTYPTSFVGREVDLAEIVRRLRDPSCRLLSLVGPGGIGKTRLALEAARRLATPWDGQGEYVDGCYFRRATARGRENLALRPPSRNQSATAFQAVSCLKRSWQPI